MNQFVDDHREDIAKEIYKKGRLLKMADNEQIAETVLCNGNEIIKRNIPFSPPDMSELEVEEVASTIRSGWITTGPRTKKLEHRLAEYLGTSKVVCLNSATAADELNLRILGVGPGDEVMVA